MKVQLGPDMTLVLVPSLDCTPTNHRCAIGRKLRTWRRYGGHPGEQ
jgi:hypothetical protein